MKITVLDVNDNAPKFIRMVVLPDQGVRVSQEPHITDESIEDVQTGDSVATGGRRSPLLLVPENTTIGAPIIRLLADDKDEGANAAITYSLGNETTSDSGVRSRRYDATSRRYFHLDPRTAEISVARSLPPEKDIRLFVVAKDAGGLSDNITVRIHVTDVNDHAPVFDKSWYTFDVAEGTYNDLTIGTIRAIDADYGANAELTYELITSHEDSGSSNASRSFSVDASEGVIRVSGTLDREKIMTHRLLVVARDQGSPSLSSSVEVEINVLDVNDNAPMFHDYDELEEGTVRLPVYRVSVLENIPIGTQVTKVHANDSDFAGNGNGLILFDLSYQDRAEKQYFAVDSKEGIITTIAKLDYETKRSHRLIVTASDLGSPVSLTSSAVVLVTVLNVDDDDEDGAGQESDNEVHKMPTFQHRYYEVEVDENATVPLLVAQLDLAEDYRGDHIRYSVVADGSDSRDHFSVDPKNGSLYLMTEIDRETRDRYEAKVRVDRVKIGRGMPVMIYPVTGERLNGLAANEARVVVRVKDVNDNAPRFKSKGRPILAAIPTTAHYGYEVVKVEVRMCVCMYASRADADSKRVGFNPFCFLLLALSRSLFSLFRSCLSFSRALFPT